MSKHPDAIDRNATQDRIDWSMELMASDPKKWRSHCLAAAKKLEADYPDTFGGLLARLKLAMTKTLKVVR